MNMCVIDWTATAAWVQAIGSIGAILAAIWIGNRQHRQNLEFVSDERKRVDEERQRIEKEQAEFERVLSPLVLDPLKKLERDGGIACRSANKYYGKNETPDAEVKQNMADFIAQVRETRRQLELCRDLFGDKPGHLRAHTRALQVMDGLISAFSYTVKDIERRENRDKYIRENPQIDHEPAETFTTDVLEMGLFALGSEVAYFGLKY